MSLSLVSSDTVQKRASLQVQNPLWHREAELIALKYPTLWLFAHRSCALRCRRTNNTPERCVVSSICSVRMFIREYEYLHTSCMWTSGTLPKAREDEQQLHSRRTTRNYDLRVSMFYSIKLYQHYRLFKQLIWASKCFRNPLELFYMPDGFWRVLYQKNTFKFNLFQYQLRCCSFSTVRPL